MKFRPAILLVLLPPLGWLIGWYAAEAIKASTAPAIEHRLADNPATKDLPLAIKGPEGGVVDAGVLVRLSIDGDYPLLRWKCVPKSQNFEIVDGGKRAMFCSPSAGVFTFILTASDGKELADAELVVTVNGPAPPGPGPGPTPPVLPLKALVKGWIAKVDSPTKYDESQRLAQSFESVSSMIAAGALKDAQPIIDATKSSNQIALGAAKERWLSFFTAMQSELNSREKSGKLDYQALWLEIAGALREVQPAPLPAPQPAKTAAPAGQRRAA